MNVGTKSTQGNKRNTMVPSQEDSQDSQNINKRIKIESHNSIQTDSQDSEYAGTVTTTSTILDSQDTMISEVPSDHDTNLLMSTDEGGSLSMHSENLTNSSTDSGNNNNRHAGFVPGVSSYPIFRDKNNHTPQRIMANKIDTSNLISSNISQVNEGETNKNADTPAIGILSTESKVGTTIPGSSPPLGGTSRESNGGTTVPGSSPPTGGHSQAPDVESLIADSPLLSEEEKSLIRLFFSKYGKNVFSNVCILCLYCRSVHQPSCLTPIV